MHGVGFPGNLIQLIINGWLKGDKISINVLLQKMITYSKPLYKSGSVSLAHYLFLMLFLCGKLILRSSNHNQEEILSHYYYIYIFFYIMIIVDVLFYFPLSEFSDHIVTLTFSNECIIGPDIAQSVMDSSTIEPSLCRKLTIPPGSSPLYLN